MKTYIAKPSELADGRVWHVIDAGGKPLGRVASEIAKLLRGKHKPSFSPHQDCGDHVIVLNASQIVLTGRKMEQKMYHRHSGYPGGLTSTNYQTLVANKPDFVIRKAVKGMLPRTVLGAQALRRLRVFAGGEHTHAAQNPQPYAL